MVEEAGGEAQPASALYHTPAKREKEQMTLPSLPVKIHQIKHKY